MKNALTYLTRKCPRGCAYCALRNAKGIGEELTEKQWVDAFTILNQMELDFNLILGNETWLLKESLIPIMKVNQVPYALYTTCMEPLFTQMRDMLFTTGGIDNLSCGFDYAPPYPDAHGLDDSVKKSKDAWTGFQWVKSNYPTLDTQGTMTVHKKNYQELPSVIASLTALGVFIGVNFIHWDKDGGFDFFPGRDELRAFLFTDEDIPEVLSILQIVLQSPGNLQNPEFLQAVIQTPELLQMQWHCGGDPYGGPTVDADGSLRCCGYRKGDETPKFSIFDLPEKHKEWKRAVFNDAMRCPGCFWSYSWMFHYWNTQDEEFGKKVFTKHAGKHIEKIHWTTRKIE